MKMKDVPEAVTIINPHGREVLVSKDEADRLLENSKEKKPEKQGFSLPKDKGKKKTDT